MGRGEYQVFEVELEQCVCYVDANTGMQRVSRSSMYFWMEDDVNFFTVGTPSKFRKYHFTEKEHLISQKNVKN